MGHEKSSSDIWLNGSIRFPVYYEDTDFTGFVYHANYLKYFERGREELVGIDHVRELYERGVHFVVARLEVAYHAPARHGDLLEIETRMRLSDSPVGIVDQVAWKVPRDNPDSGRREKLVSVRVKLVPLNNQGEITPVPDDVKEFYLRLYAEQATPARQS